MHLSWNEIRARAARFAEEWKDAHYERGESQTFYNEFFEVFGNKLRPIVGDDPWLRLRMKFLGALQDDLDVRLGHRLPQIPTHDVAAAAVQNAAPVVERPTDVDVSRGLSGSRRNRIGHGGDFFERRMDCGTGGKHSCPVRAFSAALRRWRGLA